VTPDSKDQPNEDMARHRAGLEAALATWRRGVPKEPIEKDYFIYLMESAIAAYHEVIGRSA
jgi:hypothetical protein